MNDINNFTKQDMLYNFKPHTKGDTFLGLLMSVAIDGVPLDLTGYTIRMQLRIRHESPSVAFEFSTNNTTSGVITLVGADEFYLEPCVIDIPARTYVYDIEFTSPAGNVRTWVKGEWQILPEVTR